MLIKKAVCGGIVVLLVALMASAQAIYQPKFKGDPARSDSEAAALGYVRTFLRAQRIYKRKNTHYATTLMELTKTGSFTRRMASTDRGDYTVKFRDHKEKEEFEITMVPKQEDSAHRSFFSDQEGKIRVAEQGEADENSPILKADSEESNR
jgi:hypothetical protein